jgi:hypothetical protein
MDSDRKIGVRKRMLYSVTCMCTVCLVSGLFLSFPRLLLEICVNHERG